MSKTEILAIDLLRIDGDTQCRLKIDEDTVEDYASLIVDTNWPFPPLDVFHDGSDYFVGDGFHRLLAGRRVNRASIPCRVHKGTARDAKIFGMTANDKHGMRMTRADKRACVEWLLDNGDMTQKAIAEAAGVSPRTVKYIVAENREDRIQWTSKPKVDLGEKVQISPNTPNRGVPGEDGSLDTEEPQESAPAPPRKGRAKRGGKPQKQFDGEAYYKQWHDRLGPLVRLVSAIARARGESNTEPHEKVRQILRTATDEMKKWMGVKE